MKNKRSKLERWSKSHNGVNKNYNTSNYIISSNSYTN
jgi:hypothetical protein